MHSTVCGASPPEPWHDRQADQGPTGTQHVSRNGQASGLTSNCLLSCFWSSALVAWREGPDADHPGCR
jgi:hypothetical protein